MIKPGIGLAAILSSVTASAGVVTFENLPTTANSNQVGGQELVVPVDGFSFTSPTTPPDFGTYRWIYLKLPNPELQSPPYEAYGVGVRGTTALCSAHYYSYTTRTYNIARSDGGLWRFNSAYFTAAWEISVIRLVGMRNGVTVFDFTQAISNTQQTLVSLPSMPEAATWIDTLKISNSPSSPGIGRHFIMDDMSYEIPAPGALSCMAGCLTGLRNRRRRRMARDA